MADLGMKVGGGNKEIKWEYRLRLVYGWLR